jgi:aromatic ring hydroxylase
VRKKLDHFWAMPFLESFGPMKPYRPAWDLVGLEFAGRITKYEKFYAGSFFVVRNHSFREALWNDFHPIVARQLDAMALPFEAQ